MAECSYARCLQERRLIKRELMKWSKDMLHIVGLERVAEELMERMKWKSYQESLTRTYSNTDQVTPSAEQLAKEQQNDCERERQHKRDPQTVSSNNTREDLETELLFVAPKVEDHRQPEDGRSIGKQLHKREDYSNELAVELKLKAEISGNTTTATSHNHSQVNSSDSSNNINSISNGNGNGNDTDNGTNSNNTKSSLQIESNITKTSSICTKETSARRNAASIPPPPPPPPPPEPVDWKPNEKCHFCVDGKLLTVNAKGELVAESGPTVAETDHGPRLDTDSDSNESSHLAGNTAAGGPLITNNINSNNRVNLNKFLTSRLRDLPANMTSMDSMAAQLAVMQRFSGYPNLNWIQLVHQQQQQQQHQQQQQQQQQQTAQATNAATPTTSDTSAATVSPSPKDSPSPSDATGEQPLDLSSKPSPNSSISGDVNSVRTNPSRATPTPIARRTYTDDDLNNAMQEIISGRLGARKAADQYNVPRSTLRNKVSRQNMGVKRGSVHMPAELQELEMDKDLSDDEGGDNSNVSTPQPDIQPALDELTNRIASSSTLRQLCANNGNYATAKADSDMSASANLSPKLNAVRADSAKPDAGMSTSTVTAQSQSSPQPQPQLAPMLIDPTMLIQLVLAAGTVNALQAPRLDQTVTLRDLILNLKDALEARTSTGVSDSALNNGKPNIFDQPLLLQKLQQQQTPPYSHRLPKSETPETTSSLDANETADDPSTILKIPSYKPVAGSSGGARASCSPSLLCNNNASSMPNRNGDSPNSAPSPRMANSMLAAAVSGAGAAASRQANDISVISQPLLHRHNLGGGSAAGRDSQSPHSLSFRDVIANSIHRNMAEHVNQDAHAAATATMLGLGLDVERNNSSSGVNDYKKPSISVVKNIGGTDTSRFGAAPNILSSTSSGAGAHNSHHHHQPHAHLQHAHHPHHHHSTHHLSRQEAAALAAGKGTRPKRGKYRNYDRDSLIEAVRAVQRGEMSVHRAGSYFGVPHSTLEYKVKERHLMRPRKREPKPQPGLDGSTSSASKSNSNIPGLDKLKMGTGASAGSNAKLNKNSSNSAAPFPSAAPNGMKLPMFDASVPVPLQYTQHLFWQHSPAAAFGQMQMDFNRNAASSGTGGATAELLKSHTQRYQEEVLRSAGSGTSGSAGVGLTNANTPSPIASPLSAQSAHHALSMKSARELAENIYDGGANGSSILDGIIRKTLDRKSGDVVPSSGVGGALRDQLMAKKSTLPYNNNRNNDHASSSTKRLGSPLPFTQIKRERTSPPRSTDEEASHSGAENTDYEHNNNNNNNSKSSLSGNGGLMGVEEHQQRSRLTSRDSETDASSNRSEMLHMHHNHNSNNKNADLNGSSADAHPKLEPLAELGGTSILQEKLAQIKAEQESEENL